MMVISMASVGEVFPNETQIHTQFKLIPTDQSRILGPASLWFGLFNLGDE